MYQWPQSEPSSACTWILIYSSNEKLNALQKIMWVNGPQLTPSDERDHIHLALTELGSTCTVYGGWGKNGRRDEVVPLPLCPSDEVCINWVAENVIQNGASTTKESKYGRHRLHVVDIDVPAFRSSSKRFVCELGCVKAMLAGKCI